MPSAPTSPPPPPPPPHFMSMSGVDQNAPVEETDTAKGADHCEAADSSKSRILQKQLEFEQLLMNNQLWAQEQAVKLEVDIKSVALQTALEATEVCKFLPGRRNDSVVEVVKELSSRRPSTGVQKQQPFTLDRASSQIAGVEKDLVAEKDGTHRGTESHVSSHRRHGSHRSTRGRSRSRSRDRARHRSRSRSRDRYSRNRRDTGLGYKHRHRSRSRSRSKSRSTRRIQSGRDKSISKNRGYSSKSPTNIVPQRESRSKNRGYSSRSPPKKLFQE